MKRKTTYGFWLRLAVTLAAIAYLATRIDLREVIAACAHTSVVYLLLAFLNNLLARLLTAYQMGYAMRPHGVRYGLWQMFSITMRTLFYGWFLPGEISAAGIKWYLISQIDGLRAQTLASMVYVRVTQVILLFGMGLAALMIDWPFESRALLPVGWTLLAIMLAAVLALHSPFFVPVVARLRAHRLYRRLPESVTKRVNNILDSFCAIGGIRVRDILMLWATSLLFKLAVTVSFWFIGLSLGLHLSFLTLIWINSVVEFVQLLPISIAGLGPREASVVYMLRFYGTPDSVGLTFSLIIFFLRMLVILVGGLLVLGETIHSRRMRGSGASAAQDAPRDHP